MDLNQAKDGKISKEELKFYLDHWGMDLNEQNLLHLFNEFD